VTAPTSLTHRKPGLAEAMGLLPIRERWRQARIALRGEEDVPASRFDLSSLAMLRPRMGIPLWSGRWWRPRQVLLTNLFNHTQTDPMLGWSVKRTQVQDFRGRDMTYDSHNGTDLSVPVGTTLLTAAPGVVVDVVSEFNRGGLKVFIDHGRGLMTCYAHLARALVTAGQPVGRGQAIAITGYSGLDGFVTFPFGVPHVHFNTWLNGEPVDPFARDGEESLWRGGEPRPPTEEGQATPASSWDVEAIDAMVAGCRTPAVRECLQGLTVERRAALTVIASNYYPTRFPTRLNPYGREFPRAPLLDLPFRPDVVDGAVFVDAL